MEYSTSIGHDATSSGVSEPEFMQLQSSDHPGMVMVSALFTGNNYFAWSRAIKRALTAKMKLDFIEGTAIRPPVNSDEFKRWNRIDSMVTTWVLNCMTKELAESFMYVGSSRELWIELEARYGERCTCNVNKAVDDLNASNHLMQFLVGLNPIYEQARSQILLLEPLPTVTKAYSMLLRMEKQMQVNISNVDNGAAFQARGQNYRKKNFADKKTMVCDHCQKAGHTRDSCFKLLGVPDWYRDMTEQRKKAGGRGKGFIAQMTDEASLTMDESKHSNLADLVRMEMKKYMKEEIPLDPLKINYAQLDNFAGSSAISASDLSSSWIIDSGATHHICADFKLFHSYTKLTNPMIIHLPNGHSQSVSHIGSLHLCSEIELTQVLHIPSFSDQKTNRVLATAHLIRNLYILESVSVPTKPASLTCTPYSCIADLNQSDLWHQRLGHLSHNSIKHIGA
ncbi:uncharacterized protein LOC110013112 [Sesamum indicum]|uniref:Uncharacterized protein LOC110013112 n=1 Tax=Sesamum indicum TaxID=4182 RepID=A0A8M8VE17_SESIN|nr:uncharacterized protein LOC110013112 [Sesamum indicum]